MAQTLTKAALLKAQSMLSQWFMEDNPTKYEYREAANTAKAMLAKNSAITAPALINGNGKFRGMEVNWLTPGSDSIVTDGAADAHTMSCTLSEGQGTTSDSKLYTNNYEIVSLVEVDDDVYTSVVSVEELLANRFSKAMKDLKFRLNRKCIDFLDTNKTAVNNDGSLPTGVTYATGVYSVDSAVIPLTTPEALTELDFIVENNDIDAYTYITGRKNFSSAIKNADFQRLNDSQRSLVRFDDYDMYFDTKRLDARLTGANTFAVGQGTYALWDYVHPGKTTEPTQIEDNKWEYYMEDPDILVNDNGTLRPLRYNVFYTRVCNGGDNSTWNRTYTHRFEIALVGGLYTAPAASDGHTGILKFQAVTTP